MNLRATRYVWMLSRVAGGKQLITAAVLDFLLAVAYRIPEGPFYETAPTTMAQWEAMTKVSRRHLSDIRDLLVRIGELQQGGDGAPVRTGGPDDGAPAWPKRAVYQLTGLAGPLFRIVTPWDVDEENSELGSVFRGGNDELSSELDYQTRNSVHGFVDRTTELSPESRQNAEPSSGFRFSNSELSSEFRRKTRNLVPSFGVPPEVRTFSDLSTTHHDDDERVTVPEALSSAHAFLDRWCAEYPAYNAGARFVLRVDRDLPVVLELLATYDRETLWAMAVELWKATPDGDRRTRSLAATDRSLLILHRGANTLAQVVARARAGSRAATAPRACRYRHTPPCPDNISCAERERQLLGRREAEVAVG